MIHRVDSAAARTRFEKALVGGPCPVKTLLGSRLEAFGEMPGSGWSFYTTRDSQNPLALAVRGTSGWMAGSADTDHLELLLRVMGVTGLTLAQDACVPTGWQCSETKTTFVLAPESRIPEGEPPEKFVLSKEPGLWSVAQLVAEQPGFDSESRDNFYADSCALTNRGLARIWAGELNEKTVVTAGAYSIWNGTACLAAIYTRPEYRHQQLGRHITAKLTNSLCSEGLYTVLEAAPGREEFYRSLGFKELGVTQRFCPVINSK